MGRDNEFEAAAFANLDTWLQSQRVPDRRRIFCVEAIQAFTTRNLGDLFRQGGQLGISTAREWGVTGQLVMLHLLESQTYQDSLLKTHMLKEFASGVITPLAPNPTVQMYFAQPQHLQGTFEQDMQQVLGSGMDYLGVVTEVDYNSLRASLHRRSFPQ